MINAIIRATIQLRINTENNSITFSQVHIFHTEQSIQFLMKDTKPWHHSIVGVNIKQ